VTSNAEGLRESEDMTEYVADVWGVAGAPVEARVSVPASAVNLASQGQDPDLPPVVAGLFVSALVQAGYPVERELEEVGALRLANPDLVRDHKNNSMPGTAWPAWLFDPQPSVWIEEFPAKPQPWPVFVAIGSTVIAEFYPWKRTRKA